MTPKNSVRNWLVVFGLLDALLLGRFLDGISWPQLPEDIPMWFRVVESMRPIFTLSLAASAFGLATQREWAFIVTYIQFPCRYLYVVLSFGFFTLAARFIPSQYAYHGIVYFAFLLEAVRLATTVWADRQISGGPRLQFSMRSALVAVSIFCAIAALVRLFLMS